MDTNSSARKDDLRPQLEGAKKQLAELREKLAKTPDKFPLLQMERRAKVQKLEAEIRVRYGVELEEHAQNPAEVAKQGIKAVMDQRGTQPNAPQKHIGVQRLEAIKKPAPQEIEHAARADTIRT